MTNTIGRTLRLISVTILIGGCAGPDQGLSASAGDTSRPESSGGQVDRSDTTADTKRTLADVQAEAIADLQQRLGGAVAVLVVSAQRVTWPDGSAGCPRPGMVYTQALVPGTRVVLEWQDKNYYYHGRGMGMPRLCSNSPGQPVETPANS
jgi:hypothetical protein